MSDTLAGTGMSMESWAARRSAHAPGASVVTPDMDPGPERATGEAPAQIEVSGLTGRAQGLDAAWRAREPRVEDDAVTHLEALGGGAELDDLGHHLVPGDMRERREGGHGIVDVTLAEVAQDELGVGPADARQDRPGDDPVRTGRSGVLDDVEPERERRPACARDRRSVVVSPRRARVRRRTRALSRSSLLVMTGPIESRLCRSGPPAQTGRCPSGAPSRRGPWWVETRVAGSHDPLGLQRLELGRRQSHEVAPHLAVVLPRVRGRHWGRARPRPPASDTAPAGAGGRGRGRRRRRGRGGPRSARRGRCPGRCRRWPRARRGRCRRARPRPRSGSMSTPPRWR